MKKHCIALLGIFCLQTAFAHNQVDFVFHHLPIAGAKPTKPIYLFVDASLENAGDVHSAGTPVSGLPIDGRSVDNARGGLLAPDPSGNYIISMDCSFTRIKGEKQSGGFVIKPIPKNGTVTIDVQCPLDKEGQLAAPIYQIDIKSK
jgi:hypothetical protein